MWLFAGDYCEVSILKQEIKIHLGDPCWKLLTEKDEKEENSNTRVLKELLLAIKCEQQDEILPCVNHVEWCFEFLMRVIV